MRRLLVLASILTLFLSLASCRQEQVKLLLGGSGWNKVVIIDKETKQIEWEYPLEKGWECNSVACTPEGNILFSYRKGAKVVTKDHQELWNIPAPEGCEMQTARVLPDGNILLAWAGHPSVIMEVDKEGKEICRTEYETGIERSHAQFRQVNKNTIGNYMIPLMGGKTVCEVSPQGELVRSTDLGGNFFTVLHDRDDLYWVACGDRHILLKANMQTGEVVAQYGQDDIQGVRLFFVAGLCKSENGGIYVCNWQGHDKTAKEAGSPQVFEMDESGKVVWSLNDNERFGMISDVCIMK